MIIVGEEKPMYEPGSGRPHIVGIGGTTRSASSSEAALRMCLRLAEKLGASTAAFVGADLAKLPMYNPGVAERGEVGAKLAAELRRADGVVIASAGYHGGVSGLVKNAIDYLEDLREDQRPYLQGMPVGLIATGAGWQGAVMTLSQLRTIVHALRGWPTPMGAVINSAEVSFDRDFCTDNAQVAFQLETIACDLVGFGSKVTCMAGLGSEGAGQ
jgi:FMN reductase